jgi:hypothetical protein
MNLDDTAEFLGAALQSDPHTQKQAEAKITEAQTAFPGSSLFGLPSRVVAVVVVNFLNYFLLCFVACFACLFM